MKQRRKQRHNKSHFHRRNKTCKGYCFQTERKEILAADIGYSVGVEKETVDEWLDPPPIKTGTAHT